MKKLKIKCFKKKKKASPCLLLVKEIVEDILQLLLVLVGQAGPVRPVT